MKISRCFLILAFIVVPLSAADLYEAILGPGVDPQIKSKQAPSVTIRKLAPAERDEITAAGGGDLAALPEAKGAKIPQIPYPFDMRRNGQTATVTCIVQVSPAGKVTKTYRLGDDSDLLFIECARSLVEAKFPKAERTKYYRVVAHAGLTPTPRAR